MQGRDQRAAAETGSEWTGRQIEIPPFECASSAWRNEGKAQSSQVLDCLY